MDLEIAVIGAGLMGHGIAQAFATAGHSVRLTDTDQDTLKAVPRRISASLKELAIEEEPVLARIRLVPALRETVEGCDAVIETAPEKLEIKCRIFREIAEIAPSTALLASNTSSIPITDIGRHLPDHARRRLVGIHWWNPPVLIPLVEVIRTDFLDPAYFERAFQLMSSIGKEPVRVNRDIPGFIGNRLLHALWREAISLVNAGVCDAETIDKVVKRGFGLRLSVLGPMENADLVGLELARDVHSTIFPSLEKSSEPSPLLNRLIREHKLGMRTGEGLRKWTEEQITETERRLFSHLLATARNGKS
jgi:3-hydroxybutyryl-CoA dehydrogenase